MWTCGPGGDNERHGEHALAILARSPATLRALGWLGLVHPDERREAQGRWERAVHEGRSLDLEARMRLEAGWLPCRVSVDPIRDSEGQVCGWVGTALRAAEGGPEASRHLADEVPEMLWAATPSGAIDYANRHMLDILGRQARDLTGLRWIDLVHPDDRPALRRALRHGGHESHGGPLQVEVRLQRARDGAWVWHLVRGVAARDAGGAITRWVGSCTDIDLHRRTEDHLRVSEERLRQLADAMPQIVWTAGPGGEVDYFNARWYAWTGRHAPEQPDEPWEEVLHPDDVERWRASWSRAIRTGEGRDIECRFRDASGFRWFLGRVRPVRDASGVVVRWFGTFTEIDGIVRAREALRDRSAELSEADRRKDDFLAILGHELRNPLGALASNLRLLQARLPEDDGLVGLTDVMDRQVRRMSHLLDDLLDLARIHRGKLRLQREPVTAASVVQRAVESVMPLIERRAHRLEVHVEPGLCVSADATRLAQILENLLSNAARYTDPGGDIRVEAVADGPMAQISVIDDGRGLDAAALVRIFEPFTQVRGESTACDGLGIGLTIVRQLVELHGGRVVAHSGGPGRGARFTFSVPLGTGCPVERDRRAQADSDTSRARRILVVDDNVDGATGLASLLTLHGYRVDIATDGAGAREEVKRVRPEILLLDIGLPDANGFDLARSLREAGHLDDCRIIALTGFGDDRTRHQVVQSGFDGCLLKPIDFDQLLDMLACPTPNPPDRREFTSP